MKQQEPGVMIRYRTLDVWEAEYLLIIIDNDSFISYSQKYKDQARSNGASWAKAEVRWWKCQVKKTDLIQNQWN